MSSKVGTGTEMVIKVVQRRATKFTIQAIIVLGCYL